MRCQYENFCNHPVCRKCLNSDNPCEFRDEARCKWIEFRKELEKYKSTQGLDIGDLP